MKVKIVLDGQDKHDFGCNCGDCNSNGKAYSAGIYPVTEALTEINDQEVIDRCFAPSEPAALDRARKFALTNGWQIVEERL